MTNFADDEFRGKLKWNIGVVTKQNLKQNLKERQMANVETKEIYNDEKFKVKFTATDAKDEPATIKNLTVTSSNEFAATVVQDTTDITVAEIIGNKNGETTILADLGDGPVAKLNVVTLGGPPVNVTIEIGPVEKQ